MTIQLTPGDKSRVEEGNPDGHLHYVLRGGDYNGWWYFNKKWQGRSPAEPVIVEVAEGEVATFTEPGDKASCPDKKSEGHVWIAASNFVLRSGRGSLRIQGDGHATAVKIMGFGARDVARNVLIENIRCHETGGCLPGLRTSNVQFYGVVCTGTGHYSEELKRGRHHGWYIQSAASNWTTLRHCVVADGFATGVQVYGSSRHKVRNVRLEECVIVVPSSRAPAGTKVAPCVQFGDEYGFADGLVVDGGIYWNGMGYPEGGGLGHRAFQLGTDEVTSNGSVNITSAILGGAISLTEPFELSVTESKLYWRRGTGRMRPVTGDKPSRLTMDGTVEVQAVGRGDANTLPGEYYIIPNERERGRGIVAILNWPDAESVTVNIGSFTEPHKRYTAERLDDADQEVIEFTTDPLGNGLDLPMRDPPNPRASGRRMGVWEVRRR